MKNVLLIYEMVPESTNIVLLRDVDDLLEKQLMSVAGTFCNCDVLTDEQQSVHDFIYTALEKDGIWNSIKADTRKPLPSLPDGTIVIVCGFVL